MTDPATEPGTQGSPQAAPEAGTAIPDQSPAPALETAPAPSTATGTPPAPPPPMSKDARVALGLGLLALSALLVGHLLWVWSFAARLTGLEGTATAHVRVHWFGFAFSPTVDFAMLLVVALTAMAGSTVQSVMVFANRVGHGTLEATWAFWYVLRPGASALLGMLSYVVVKAGFLGPVNDGGKGLAFAAAVGALAGLFTDTVIAKLRGALAASPFNRPAADPGKAAGADR